MDVKTRDVCIAHGYRLTEYQIIDDSEVIDTFFNIRDGQGVIHGHDYHDIDRPLDIILRMWTNDEEDLLTA